MWIHELDKFVENGFLDQTLLVDSRGEVFEVDACFERFAQVADEFDVYVGFEEGGADLFEHAIESLEG